MVLVVASCSYEMADPTDTYNEVEHTDLTPTLHDPDPLTPSVLLFMQSQCVSDNPCVVPWFDPDAGTCVLKTIDLQGDVYCDDHNPCTTDDMCYGDYCLGEVIEGCDLDETYYY